MNNPLIEYKSGKVLGEYYYLNSKLHRDDGPAVVFYYESGRIKYEAWFKNGEQHRIAGPPVPMPAITWYDESGLTEGNEHWVDGIRTIYNYFQKRLEFRAKPEFSLSFIKRSQKGLQNEQISES